MNILGVSVLDSDDIHTILTRILRSKKKSAGNFSRRAPRALEGKSGAQRRLERV
jgi:hypothetical protein